ncbi:MAG TPA: FMN-binding negative transcriptional regulator [Allosphingosinicella sp.]|jgi:transcriptional regulator|nr:FMN-binding negative transcriptional regulator [Allosphingosinicella sp.]
MHPNRKFHLEDQAEMAVMVRALGFGTIFVQAPEGPRAVHVPVLVEGERLLFHCSRRNLVHDPLVAGTTALFVATGPHAYISPDWYGLEGRVPTWNYLAVELEGPVRPIGREETIRLLDALSAEQEALLAPKPAWTRDRISGELFETLLNGITAFEMNVTAWRGTAKMDQDKPREVRARIADALAARGDRATAEAMRE